MRYFQCSGKSGSIKLRSSRSLTINPSHLEENPMSLLWPSEPVLVCPQPLPLWSLLDSAQPPVSWPFSTWGLCSCCSVCPESWVPGKQHGLCPGLHQASTQRVPPRPLLLNNSISCRLCPCTVQRGSYQPGVVIEMYISVLLLLDRADTELLRHHWKSCGPALLRPLTLLDFYLQHSPLLETMDVFVLLSVLSLERKLLTLRDFVWFVQSLLFSSLKSAWHIIGA